MFRVIGINPVFNLKPSFLGENSNRIKRINLLEFSSAFDTAFKNTVWHLTSLLNGKM